MSPFVRRRDIIIHKEIQRKLKIAQYEPDDYLGVNSGAPEGKQLAILNFFGGDYTRKYI